MCAEYQAYWTLLLQPLSYRRKVQILVSKPVDQTVFRSDLLKYSNPKLPGSNHFSEISTETHIHSKQLQMRVVCSLYFPPRLAYQLTQSYWFISIQVVACYRHLASCVGGCTDSLQLRDELRQTREKAQTLAVAICSHLTTHLRNKSLPEGQRKEMELLWVAFSSSLELFHIDMCKVFHVGDIFSLANTDSLVQTGLQGKLGYSHAPLIVYANSISGGGLV